MLTNVVFIFCCSRTIVWRLFNFKQTTMMKINAYSDEELKMFETIINKKLNYAKTELGTTLKSLSNTNNNISANTMVAMGNKLMVEEQENLNLLAIRLKKFIVHLQAALERIKHKTYGVCRKTGRLISKERLLLVPHATLSVEAKSKRKQT